MRRIFLKRTLLAFIPFLILALTPLQFHYCKGMVKGCEGCPMMEVENALSPQILSQNSCCGIYRWEGLTFTNPLQKTDDSLKGKFNFAIQSVGLLPVVSSSLPSVDRNISLLHSYIPPPLFVLKQSFLI